MGNKKARGRERKNAKLVTPPPYGSNYADVPSIHVRQRHNWDCGLACTEMALRWVNASERSVGTVVARPLAPVTAGDPLWTIELYRGLRERGVDAAMSTAVRGVNTEHTDLDFYKGVFDGQDQGAAVARINGLFEDAEQRGWAVDEPVPTEELCGLLAEALPLTRRPVCAVALVNWYVLQSGNVLHTEFFGHCVLVVGYDAAADRVEFLDPLLGPVVRSSTKNVFDGARRSPGTDMDLILVRPN